MTRAVVIALEAGDEALLLRAHLETMNIEVQLKRIGKPSEVLSAFSFYGDRTDIAIMSGHGDGEGFIMAEMAPGIDTLELTGNRLCPADLGGVTIAAGTVISTACSTGTDGFAQAFRARGAARYIAPVGEPDGAAAPLVIAALVYGVFHRQSSWGDALERANGLVAEDSRFNHWP